MAAQFQTSHQSPHLKEREVIAGLTAIKLFLPEGGGQSWMAMRAEAAGNTPGEIADMIDSKGRRRMAVLIIKCFGNALHRYARPSW
ncbi:hypothetical protein [Hyphomicrobium sp. ghe19]|uniref:hypothetical protein n=1 Tax=Hyphomicrobium sp. ghe19 TaxID=2682968 RepID=UPI0030D18E48